MISSKGLLASMEATDDFEREPSPTLEDSPEQQLWDAAEQGDIKKLKHCLTLCKIDEADDVGG
jgi:hypothetical protein